MNKLLCGLMLAGTAMARQAVAQQSPPAFEVASIRPSAGGPVFIGVKTPGTFSADNVSLRGLIMEAWGVKAFQIQDGLDWMRDDKFDIAAKPRLTTTTESTQKRLVEMDLMLRTLLEDRFQLKIHQGTRELVTYLLTIARGVPKLQARPCAPFDAGDKPQSDFCGRSHYGANGANRTLDWTGTTMADFTHWALPNILDRPVRDETGYSANFDLHLEWAPDTEPDSTGPSIFTALQEQLGLKLVAGRAPVEVIIVDHAAKPSAN